MIMRLPEVPEDPEATVEKEVTEVLPDTAETSERLEEVRVSGGAVSSVSVVESNERFELRERCSLFEGGTSCTWRLSGWLFLAGGGRTTMND